MQQKFLALFTFKGATKMLSINDRHQKNIDNTLIALHFKGNMFYFAVLDIGILYAWNEKVNF